MEKYPSVTSSIIPIPSLLLWLVSCMLFCNAGRAGAMPPQLVVTTTNETCAGAGSITCQLVDPAGTNAAFKIYELPDTTTPIANLTGGATTLNVTVGSYQIVASEIVGGTTITYPPQTVNIISDSAPLTYAVSHTDAHCGDGTISVAIATGTAPFQYALTEGPETFPAGSNPVFSSLSGGVYKVLVTDGCGAQISQTHIVPVHPLNLQIQTTSFPDTELPACDRITVKNQISTVSATDVILYPLQLTYTIHPPGGGADIIVHNTILSGDDSAVDAQTVIPFYYDQAYTFDLVVTDPCGDDWVRNLNVVNEDMFLLLQTAPADCGGYTLQVSPNRFVGPYTISFTEMPAGFDPVDYNSGHPGPFTGESQFYGDATLPVPFGTYTVMVTDACGHSASLTQEIEDIPIEPYEQVNPHPGCQSNISDVEIVWPWQIIVSVTLVSAPAAYTGLVPGDVSGGIDNPGDFFINDLPAGDYVFELVNQCGVMFPLPVIVPEISANLDMIPSTRADCEPGKGGLRIRGTQSSVVTIQMTAAPAAYGQIMPQDVTGFVTGSGIFSMAALPPGLYSFEIFDSCGVTHVVTDAEVKPYVIDENEIQVIKHCNSFELSLEHTSQNTVSETFWLQKYNAVSLGWGHPGTDAPYVEGSAANLTNSIPLTNHFNNINLDYLGTFRVIKTFQAFENGNVSANPFKTCVEVLETFEHDGHVRIQDVIKLTCDGALSSVRVIADGVAPFTYAIIEKNSQPFFLDNGNNDTFTDLEPAIYKFSVQQYCSDSDTYVVDIASLPSLVEAYPPQPVLYSCENPANDQTGTFDLTVQDPFILGSQDGSLFAITYHSSQADAEAGTNALPNPYTGPESTLFGRIAFTAGNCYRTVSFNLIVNPIPEPGFSTNVGLCPGEGKTLIANPGYDGYLWSTGETGNSIHVDEPGTYTLTLTKNYPGSPSAASSCSATYDIIVSPQPVPSISEIRISDWTDHENTITVLLDNPENIGFEFSIGGIAWQSSNVFEGLYPGAYTVRVRDTSGCGADFQSVHLLMYPKFFTPNGDGYNDYWKVKFSDLEPGLQTFIYDRYGKFIKQLGTDSQGWDGTYTGNPLPSSDYWFLVKRADGREFRGHFAMKR